MRYWKFLRPGATSPFTGYRWPTDVWCTAAGTTADAADTRAEACRLGFHACRLDDLPYWLWEELWTVELAGPVTFTGHKVVAPRARLLTRVAAWDAAAQREFATACVRRTVHHAAEELTTAGRSPQHALLVAAVEPAADVQAAVPRPAGAPAQPAAAAQPGSALDLDLAALLAAARACRAEVNRRRERQAWLLTGYVEDALESLGSDPPASLAYIAARAANQRSDIDAADPYAMERRWQRDWLAGRLGLTADV